MISLTKYLECIDKNVNRIHNYRLGHDGSDGESDCVGLIIGGLRLAGVGYNKTHGSNYFARNMMQDGLTKLTTSNLYLGEAVFKAKEPGDSGCALPDKYKDSGDLRDYCHIGIVTSVKPLVITHCTGVDGGIARDTKLGKWKFGGKINGIDYGAKEEEVVIVSKLATVTGGDLNIRADKSTTSKRLGGIPNGTTIEVIVDDGTWSAVNYKGTGGYVMSKYLQYEDGDGTTITVDRAKLESAYNILGDLLKKG